MQTKALAVAAGMMALLFSGPAAHSTELTIQLTQYYDDGDDDYGCRLPEAWMCERDGRDGGYDRNDEEGHYRPLPPPPPSYRHRVSCWRGARYLERAGYYRVRMLDCVAPVYEYRALRRDRSWSVRMSARTGRILSVRPLSRRY